MTHFTVLHWLAIGVLTLLFTLVVVLILRTNDKQSALPAILTMLLFFVFIAFFALYILDKYTKLARLENVLQKKVLINESFSISGQIRNIGNFKIGACTLVVKISNGTIESSSDGPLFVPKSALDNLFKREASSSTIETTKSFVIAENFNKGELRNFTVFMRYPPSYSKPYTRYELSCH